MKIIDLNLNISGLILDEDESVEDFIESINVDSAYPITYEILYEEYF